MSGHPHEPTQEDTAIVKRRIVAHIFDIGVIYGVFFALIGTTGPEHGVGFFVWLWYAFFIFYWFFLEGYWDGQTIGKWTFGIKVVREDGSPCSYGASVGRNFLRVLDALPAFYIAGIAMVSMSERYQRIGDHLAETVVVRTADNEATDQL